MRATAKLTARILAAVTLVLVAASCTKETIVFRDRAPFNEPPDAALGMLGYFDADAKETTCGNCHVGIQLDWVNTNHASALAGLEASRSAQDFCYSCHTVNERGNALDAAAGWNAVTDTTVRPIYADVQCESCHGPGLDHVIDPQVDAAKPVASIVADTGLTNGCGECHEGSHHPFVEQWKESRHGTPSATFPQTREGCADCHEGKQALIAKFGETSNYLERDDGSPQNITCVVCHDPHGSPNDAQLRAPIDVGTTENLCVTCHARRGTPPSSHGPHAAQGLMVIGENVGWIPPGFQYDTTSIISSHGSAANPSLCVTCHVAQRTVTDAVTGDFQFQSVGHLFEAITCLDQTTGEPVPGPCPDTERDFSSCATAGCHGTEAVARSALVTIRSRLEFLLDQLWEDTNGDDSINAGDAGLLPQVVAMGDTTQLDVTDDVVTVAEGALWNAQLAYTSTRPYFGDGYAFGIHFGAHKASGEGVHNPFLLEALLIASINAVRAEYGLPAPPTDLRVQATPPPGLRSLR